MDRKSKATSASIPASRSSSARFIAPMLLQRTDSLPDSPQWLYELKLDGYRAIAFKRDGVVHLRSRNDNDFSERYPGVVNGLAKMPDDTVIALMNQHKMLEAAREGMGRAMLPGIDQVWYVEADGYVAIDLTSALVNGHDELGWAALRSSTCRSRGTMACGARRCRRSSIPTRTRSG